MGLRPKPPAAASGDPFAPRRGRRAALCAAWDGYSTRTELMSVLKSASQRTTVRLGPVSLKK